MWSNTQLLEHLQRTLSIFTGVWQQMCKPFIEAVHVTEGGMIPHTEPHYPYIMIPCVIGIAFISIALAKKIMCMLIERRE